MQHSDTNSAGGPHPTGVNLTRGAPTRSGLTRPGLTRSGLTRPGLTRPGLTRSGLTRLTGTSAKGEAIALQNISIVNRLQHHHSLAAESILPAPPRPPRQAAQPAIC